jgi:ribosomal protein S18 acetylase RimI-like enzyme
MSDLPESLFLDPMWHALHGPHRHLAIVAGDACRYPADVAPFAAVAGPEPSALRDLHSLLAPGESVWIVDHGHPALPGLSLQGALECLQMVLPRGVVPPEQGMQPPPMTGVVPLSSINAHEMVALTQLAFPGFFRASTHRMGSYCGVRENGELVAMGGERLRLEGYPELSGICTHPAHRGRGLATSVIGHLVRNHALEGLVSWLHVGAPNTRAIELYAGLGFEPVRRIMLHRIARTD